MCLKQCVIFVYLFLITQKVESITNPTDEYTILEDERRAAEKIQANKHQFPEINSAETKQTINSLNIGPTSSATPYPHGNKANIYEGGYGLQHRQPEYMQDRFQFSSSGFKGPGGYQGGYSSGASFPGEYSGGYGHTSGSGYGPSSSGGYGHIGGGGYGHIGGGGYGSGSSGVHGYGGYESHAPTDYHYGGGDDSAGSFYGLSALKNPFILKKFLLPLAGIALLGAAAALSANPVLLQLGVIKGKRRRRSLTEDVPLPYSFYYRNNDRSNKNRSNKEH